MKAIKRNVENLKKVADSIVSVPFSGGSFEIDFFSAADNTIRLVSYHRVSIGCTVLNEIPINYMYRVSFVGNNLYLTLWF